MTILSQAHELTQGDLVYDSPVDADAPWVFSTLADGFTLGHPAPLVEEVRSLLTDGALAVVTGHDNREISFLLQVSATDGLAMAQAEAALMAEKMAARPSPLVYTPPAVDAWTAVFDVVHMDVERVYEEAWDLDEARRQNRVYRVTLTCLPWARDLETTIIPALPVPQNPGVPATYTVVDECSSATGWSVIPCHSMHYTSRSITTGTASGNTYIRGNGTLQPASGFGWLGLLRPGTIAMSGDPYLTVDVGVSIAAEGGIRLSYGSLTETGRTFVLPVGVQALAPGWTRYYFEVPDSVPNVRVEAWWSHAVSSASARALLVYEIGRTDRLEINGSNGFQIARTAVVEGSAPTQAAVSFDAGANPLIGSTALIYTGTSPVVPLRNLRTSSAAVTVDATKVSGGTNNLSAPMVFRVPVAQVTSATYGLLARLSSTGTYAVNWAARVVASDGTDIPGSDLVFNGSALVVNTTADPWKIHDIAAIQMPPIAIEGASTHVVEITLSMASSGTSVLVDEAWLCDTDNGAVTVIHEPSAFQLSKVELRSPQLDSPRPAVIGTWVTHGSQDISRLATPGTHLFKPGTVHVFTATDLAKYALCELTYYRRYDTHPGPALEESVA